MDSYEHALFKPVCVRMYRVLTLQRDTVTQSDDTQMRTIGLEPITIMDVILSHKRIPISPSAHTTSSRHRRLCKFFFLPKSE